MKKSLIALAVGHALIAHADDTPHVELEALEITITNPFSQQVGTQKLTAEQIKNRPTGNGNLSELLKNNPNVRYANHADNSNTAGEIAPNEVSIHGAKFYENNYTIDGLSNNDNINPGSGATGNLYSNTATGNLAGYNPISLPAGGTQSFWIDSSLVKNIEVFDSNISAKYGQFTGGVINANIKDPDTRPSGRIWYRTTRDDWANFHIQEQDKEKFEQANELYHQPRFTKQQYGVEISQPITDKASVLFAYNRSTSKIPFYHDVMSQWENQERSNETYLLKGSYKPSDNNTIKATFMYSPHESSYPKANVKNGLFTNTGGGYRANIEWDKKSHWGKMTSYLGYRKTGNQIKHQSDTFHNYYGNTTGVTTGTTNLGTDAYDWCTSRNLTTNVCISAHTGGYGEFSTEKQTYTAKQDFKFNTIGQTLKHDISTGWQFDHATASYERAKDVHNYSETSTPAFRNNVTSCTECVVGVYFTNTRTLYPARQVKASDNTFSHYAENSMTYKNLNLVAGLRTDYNQYLGNIDLAPRLSFTYDVFGNKNTRLIGGFNRYYANSMLAYKLREGIGVAQTQTRQVSGRTLSNWRTNDGYNGLRYNISSLDTPYTDELNLGVAQQWANSLWTLKWVRRDAKDQFTRVTEGSGTNAVRVLANNGTSKNQNFTLSVNSLSPINIKDVADVSWSFGASYNKSKSNNTYYDDATLDGDGITKAVYRGKLLAVGEVPQMDFNAGWTSFLAVNTHFPALNLDWSQRLSYTDGHRSIERDSITCNSSVAGCGDYIGRAYLYNDKDNPNAFTWDWRLGYKLPLSGEKSLEFTADVNNVLDKKIVTSSASSTTTSGNTTYKMGRNFWLGVSYNW